MQLDSPAAADHYHHCKLMMMMMMSVLPEILNCLKVIAKSTGGVPVCFCHYNALI
jgi:hypothetical protein